MIELQSYYLSALGKIRKRLGDNNYNTIKNTLNNAFDNNEKKLHVMWIEALLEKYYDKMYHYGLLTLEKIK